MPTYTINLYPFSHVPGVQKNSPLNVGLNKGGNTTFTDNGKTITITDDDSFLQDFAAPGHNNPETGDYSKLAEATSFSSTHFGSGVSYGINTRVNAVAQIEVANNTTGESGFAQLVVFGSTLNGQTFVAYPFEVSEGDSLTWTPTNNDSGVPVGERYGDTQGYDYSEFDGAPPSTSEYTIGLYPLEQIPGVPTGSVLAGQAFNTGGTITFSNVGASVTITDDDAYAEDFAGQINPETGGNPVLTNDFSLGGTTYSAGTQINAVAQVEVVNDTTGETGFAQIFALGGTTDGPAFVAYPFPVTEGDSLTFTATDNFAAVPNSFSNTQGYEYSEFDLPEDQVSSTPPLVSSPPAPDNSHVATEIIVSGADVAKNPVVNANSSAGYQGQGQITVNAQSVFQDDDIVVLKVNQVDANGEISPTSNSGLADVTVYDSYEDYLAGTVKYHYAPQNPGQTANAQTSIAGLGDGYVNFTSANIMQPQNGGPSFNQLFVAPNSGIGSSGSGTFSTKQQFDFNSDGDFDDFLEDGNTNFLVGNFAAQLICFTSGTRIATASGDRRIEDLVAGDLVLTMDRGYQPIRWIGSSKRPATGDLAPILIRKGALGNDRDLRVSPQHRMLLQGWQAEMLFGEEEVLATAKSLVNDHSILRDEGGEVEYFHILFDTHEIIYAEGAPSESFHPGEQAWKALDQATRDEILTLFPELEASDHASYGASVRASLKHGEGQLLSETLTSTSN